MADDNRNLPARTNTEKGLLQNSGVRAGSLLEQAMAHLTPEQRNALMAKAGDELLRLQVKVQEQTLDYEAGKRAIEDHIQAFAMLEKGGRLTRQSVESTVKTGAGTMRIESKSGATCFVATAAYRDEDHPDVAFLRRYRDEVLTGSLFGRAFISCYWVVGPKLARVVSWSPRLRLGARGVLSFIVRRMRQP